MSEPAGKQIFSFDNSLGSYQASGMGWGTHYAAPRWSLSQGVCFAITAMWIRRTYECAGDLKMLSEIGTPLQIELAQAVYEKFKFNTDPAFPGSYGPPNEAKQRAALFHAQGLKVVSEADGAPFNKNTLVKLFEEAADHPAMFLISMNGNGGHTVGIKTGGPNLSGYWFFDANEGLYHTNMRYKFISNAEYLVKDYSFDTFDSYCLELMKR